MERNFRIEVVCATGAAPRVTHLITDGTYVSAAKLARALRRVGATKQDNCSFWWVETQVVFKMTPELFDYDHLQVLVKSSNALISRHAA